MSVYQVVYDLNKPGQDYSGLIKELKESMAWARPTESTWLIQSYDTASQVFARLKPYIDTDDRMLVIEVKPNYSGWLTKEMWEWIKKHLG